MARRRSARTRLWPFAHSPPTPPLVRPAAPLAPGKPAMARGGTNGQPGSAGAPPGVASESRASSMCLAAPDGRWAVVPVAAVLLAVAPLGGPSARAKFRREGAAWGLHERRLCLA